MEFHSTRGLFALRSSVLLVSDHTVVSVLNLSRAPDFMQYLTGQVEFTLQKIIFVRWVMVRDDPFFHFA